MGRTEFPDLQLIESEPRLDPALFHESEMALFSECTRWYAQKGLDTAGIVRDAIFRQLSLR